MQRLQRRHQHPPVPGPGGEAARAVPSQLRGPAAGAPRGGTAVEVVKQRNDNRRPGGGISLHPGSGRLMRDGWPERVELSIHEEADEEYCHRGVECFSLCRVYSIFERSSIQHKQESQ